VRLPSLAFLIILEPVVRFVLSGAALVAVLAAFLFEFSGAVSSFPFWQTIAISIGCVLLLASFLSGIEKLAFFACDLMRAVCTDVHTGVHKS
jgi:uncharacterized membrane protein